MSHQPSEYQNIFCLSVKIAEHGFITAIKEGDKGNLSTLLRCMYWVDKYVDEAPHSEKFVAETNVLNALEEGKPFVAPEGHRVSEMLFVLSDVLKTKPREIQKAFVQDVRKVFECDRVMVQTTRR